MVYVDPVPVSAVWATFYLLSTLLFLKWLMTNIMIAVWRRKTGTIRTPEDTWNRNLPQPSAEAAAVALAQQQRWLRIQENDHENLLWGIVLFGFSAVFVKPTMFVVLYVIFTFARIMHTVCYALALQPFRSIFWLLGLVATLCEIIGAIVEAFILVP